TILGLFAYPAAQKTDTAAHESRQIPAFLRSRCPGVFGAIEEGVVALSLGIHSLPRENQDELSKGKNMARRRLQEGSVFKRGTRKKVWVARWRDWVRTEDGSLKRVMRSEILGPVSELTKSDAKEKLRQKLGANQSKKDIE